jgi:hypothetical protein
LVDDEVSTGKTTLNIIHELKKVFPNVKKYSLVSMLNWSEIETDEVEFFSLFSDKFEFNQGKYSVPKNLVSENIKSSLLDEVILTDYGRFGIQQNLNLDFENLLDGIEVKNKTLILGTGEFMYPPYLLAQYLEDKGYDVYFQATTRSPINIDGIINSKLSFKDNYFENIDNFLYNIISSKYEKIIICYETSQLPETHKLKKMLENQGFDVATINF